MPISTPLLELRHVGHGYRRAGGGRHGEDVILKGVDLRLERGSILGVCGPSGSGKSTLLRLCAGLERPGTGQVLAEGLPIWSRPGRARFPRPGWVGALFQNPAASLDPNWRLARILDEPATARHRRGINQAERERQRDAVLAEVGLAGVPTRLRPGQLSGGQQQRVALARLLLAAPELIVADEPTSALDVTNAATVMHLLVRTAQTGTGIVLVSHDLALLRAVSTEIWQCQDRGLIRVD